MIRSNQNDWAARQVAQGMCRKCGKEPIYKTKLCRKHHNDACKRANEWNHAHRKRVSERARKWQKAKVAEGLCSCCGKEPIFKTTKCHKHYIEALERSKLWNNTHLEWRRAYMKKWRKENREKIRAYDKAYKERITQTSK